MNGIDTQLRVLDEVDVSADDLATWSSTSSSSELVSIYLPTHRSGREVTQDPVLFRRLVATAADEVAEREFLAAAERLVDDREFWAHGSAGLAVLAGLDGTTAVRLSEAPGELAVVSDRFHLKPLVAALGRRAEFDVLALSRHHVRFVEVTGSRAVEVEVPRMPASMPEALRFDDREAQVQSHSGARVGAGRVSATFHGQGSTTDARDADLDRYLHQVDHAVADHRSGTTRPLVLAGVDEIVGVYRKLTRCAHVLAEHVAGNPDQLRAAELADRARGFVPSAAADEERRARESFLAGATATVDTIEQALIAAAAGQVASVFVPADREYWGRYRAGHHLLEEHDTRAPGDHDLADVAATETLRHGGRAFVVPAIDIPRGGTAAATLRY
jgi:Bacterial archaeo-eukaryotic release factor family 7